MSKKREIKRSCNRIVDAAPGVGVVFTQQIMDEVISRTGASRKDVSFIMDTYREVVMDEMLKGKKVEMHRMGFIVPMKRVGYFSPMLSREVPARFHPRFVFGENVRKKYKQTVTVEVIE